jgi:hypothetical protein
MIKNREILNNINALLLFFCLVFPCIVLAEKGNISLSNGGQLNQTANYQHISSINSGTTFPEVPVMTFDYMLSAGVVSSFWLNNNNISYKI